MSGSIRILIKNEYRRLQKTIRDKIQNDEFLVDIIDSNIIDMILLFNYHFRDMTQKNYKSLIDDVFEMSDVHVCQEDRDKIYDDIHTFILWLLHIQA